MTHYIAITGSASLKDTHLLGKFGGTGNALKVGPRNQPGPATRSGLLSRTIFFFSLGLGQPGAANSCLVQPGPKPRALFLNWIKYIDKKAREKALCSSVIDIHIQGPGVFWKWIFRKIMVLSYRRQASPVPYINQSSHMLTFIFAWLNFVLRSLKGQTPVNAVCDMLCCHVPWINAKRYRYYRNVTRGQLRYLLRKVISSLKNASHSVLLKNPFAILGSCKIWPTVYTKILIYLLAFRPSVIACVTACPAAAVGPTDMIFGMMKKSLAKASRNSAMRGVRLHIYCIYFC